jgi:hypothetical protein
MMHEVLEANLLEPTGPPPLVVTSLRSIFSPARAKFASPFAKRSSPSQDVLGVSVIVDALNNPRVGTVTDRSVLGPFFMDNVRDDRFNPAPSPSPSALFPSLMRRHVHSPARRVDRVEREQWGVHVCRGSYAHIGVRVRSAWESWEWTTRVRHIRFRSLLLC